MSFLKAEWRKLAIANYLVDPHVLEKYLPYGVELDFWKDECLVSLVGFMFQNTKVLGCRIPFHTSFEEVNLRFYVKTRVGNEWRRGVVFVKEFVPRQAISFIANCLYNEHYEAISMRHQWNASSAKYEWKCGKEWHRFQIDHKIKSQEIEIGSEEEFITEHYFGYTKVTETKTNQYEVKHPRWKVYPVEGYSIKVDFAKVYGTEFSFLTKSIPQSVFLAEGSEISVERKQNLSFKQS
jgi:uncharacterized protein